MDIINIKTSSRCEMIDITSLVEKIVRESGADNGVCVIYSPHTTAAVTINERADPDVASDMTRHLSDLIPQLKSFAHCEGNSDAHVKTSLIGASEIVIIENSRLALGTWQGIFLCEFDGPRNRKIYVSVQKSS